MNDHLKALIEKSRYDDMSAAEKEQQRRSFAYGNTHFENPVITRDMVDREAEKMAAETVRAAMTDRK